MKCHPLSSNIFCTFAMSMMFLISSFCLSQKKLNSERLEELKFAVTTASTDSLRIDAYIKLGRYQLGHDFNDVESYLIKVFDLFEKNPHLIPSGDYAKAYQQLGVVNRKRGNYTEALKNYLKTKKIYESINDSLSLGSTYHNIAMVYKYQKEYNKSIQYFREAMRVKKKDSNRVTSLIVTYNMMGGCFYDMKELDSAVHYVEKASQLRVRSGLDSSNKAQNAVLTSILIEQKQFDRAIEIARKVLPDAKKEKKHESLSAWYMRMAQAYSGIGAHVLAERYTDSALQVSNKHKLRDITANVFKLRKNIFNAKKDYKKALKAYHSYTLVADTLYNIQKAKELRGIELANEFNKKRVSDSLQYEKEKALLASDIKKRKATRWRNYLIIVILILLLGALYLFNRKRLALEKAEKFILNRELKASEKKIERKKVEISNLIVESIRQIKSKKELTANLKRVSSTSFENKDLKSIVAQLNAETLEDDKILLIREKFREQNLEFHQELLKKFPKLTSTDLEICSFLKMGLGRNEIAKLRNTSIEAVKKSRHRLRKKLGIDNTTHLKDYLSTLNKN